MKQKSRLLKDFFRGTALSRMQNFRGTTWVQQMITKKTFFRINRISLVKRAIPGKRLKDVDSKEHEVFLLGNHGC